MRAPTSPRTHNNAAATTTTPLLPPLLALWPPFQTIISLSDLMGVQQRSVKLLDLLGRFAVIWTMCTAFILNLNWGNV